MDADSSDLTDPFEAERGRLKAIAYRMLGSSNEAEDAVQESWLRLSRALAQPDEPADVAESPIRNLPAWLTTTVSRICLDMLRTRASRREDLAAEPLPAATASPYAEPEDEALLADETGRALLVVLDRLSPPERVAFVLHDAFAVPFDAIAPILDRTPQTTKKLASRARQKVRGTTTPAPTPPSPPSELARQRQIVTAFLSAAKSGDLRAILELLAPDVVRRADPAALAPGRPLEARGADTVANEITLFGQASRYAEPALVNGAAAILVAPRGRLHLAITLTIAPESGLITAYELIADPARLARLDLAVPEPQPSASASPTGHATPVPPSFTYLSR